MHNGDMNDSAKDNLSRKAIRIDWLIAIVIGLFSFIVYYLTLTPSLSFLSPDGSELATIPALLGLAHMPGYPLYTWLGFLFSKIPIGDVAHRINMMSAFMGAVGVGGLYMAAVQILPKRFTWDSTPTDETMISHPLSGVLNRGCSALGSLLFAFSVTFWSQALIAEVYAVNLGMIALMLLALLRWERTQHARDFFLFALLFGLSLGTHISNLGFAPAFIIFILLTSMSALRNWRWWLAALTGFGLGLLQYAWLPLKANSLNDQMMLRNAPTTLAGIYNYTLGAFPQMKFAFPVNLLPDRLVLYIFMLQQEYGWLPMLLGIFGLFSILFRRLRHFYLFVGMYLVHVWFFIQYRVFDLEVFFIPSHFLWAIFIIFGLREVLTILGVSWRALRGQTKSRPICPAVRIGRGILACVLLISPALFNLTRNWGTNNLSGDTAINDFYANVWELLPQDAALLTQSGVFGYSAFYWQLIYEIRPDVILPALPTPNPEPDSFAGRELYSTTGAGHQRGPGALPRDLFDKDAWEVPILLGESSLTFFGPNQQLMLYHLSEEPPSAFRDKVPDTGIQAQIGSVRLVGVQVGADPVESGGVLEISLYWQFTERSTDVLRYQVIPSLDDTPLTQIPIGLGLLQRYAQEGMLDDDVILEDHFYLVIPSTTAAGDVDLNLTITTQSGESHQVKLKTLMIIDEMEMVEGWLQNAGKSYWD
jgi:hypothetical protein